MCHTVGALYVWSDIANLEVLHVSNAVDHILRLLLHTDKFPCTFHRARQNDKKDVLASELVVSWRSQFKFGFSTVLCDAMGD